MKTDEGIHFYDLSALRRKMINRETCFLNKINGEHQEYKSHLMVPPDHLTFEIKQADHLLDNLKLKK